MSYKQVNRSNIPSNPGNAIYKFAKMIKYLPKKVVLTGSLSIAEKVWLN